VAVVEPAPKSAMVLLRLLLLLAIVAVMEASVLENRDRDGSVPLLRRVDWWLLLRLWRIVD